MRNPFEVYSETDIKPRQSELSWEESALDSRSMVEGFSTPDTALRSFFWVPLVIILVLLVMGVQLFRLQIIQGSDLRAMAEGNRLRQRLLLAPRGFIQDRFGQILAQNTVNFRLVAVPVDLPKEGLEIEIEGIAALFGLDADAINAELRNANPTSFEPVVLAQDISQEQSILFATRSSEFTGFSLHATPIREYPHPEVFSHVLGFTGIISEQELDQLEDADYSRQDVIGKTGIEKQYESHLRGGNGHEQIEVDAKARVVKTLGALEPSPGNIARLTIDKELQIELHKNFLKHGNKGAAVALDPNTGAVLALLSVPGFDNNLFAHGIKSNEYEALLQNNDLPLFNRAISGTYPPGSTVKPMVAAAALEEGVVKDTTIIVDRGNLVIPNQFDPRISYNFYGWKRDGLGPMNVYSAIAESSDIYFYTAAGGHPSSSIKGLGAEKLAEYYRKFSLDRVTGIDLGGEKPGVVADPTWKAEYFKNDPIAAKWYLGDTYHIAIGQGDMLVTPLQVALWTATIAHHGIGFRPHVLDRVIDQQGNVVLQNRPAVLARTGISDTNIEKVKEGMRRTVLAGSGRQLTSLPVSCAGKTGTSQFDGSNLSRTHAWFTAFCSFENPEIVITVLVEAGGEGHATAVPIAKETLKWWTENRYKK